MKRTFQSRENRDKAWRDGGKTGFRRVARNQQTHPMYVEDYGRVLTEAECGFGNSLYRTYFAALYILED